VPKSLSKTEGPNAEMITVPITGPKYFDEKRKKEGRNKESDRRNQKKHGSVKL
jgi:hypothetical protein